MISILSWHQMFLTFNFLFCQYTGVKFIKLTCSVSFHHLLNRYSWSGKIQCSFYSAMSTMLMDFYYLTVAQLSYNNKSSKHFRFSFITLSHRCSVTCSFYCNTVSVSSFQMASNLQFNYFRALQKRSISQTQNLLLCRMDSCLYTFLNTTILTKG